MGISMLVFRGACLINMTTNMFVETVQDLLSVESSWVPLSIPSVGGFVGSGYTQNFNRTWVLPVLNNHSIFPAANHLASVGPNHLLVPFNF